MKVLNQPKSRPRKLSSYVNRLSEFDDRRFPDGLVQEAEGIRRVRGAEINRDGCLDEMRSIGLSWRGREREEGDGEFRRTGDDEGESQSLDRAHRPD